MSRILFLLFNFIFSSLIFTYSSQAEVIRVNKWDIRINGEITNDTFIEFEKAISVPSDWFNIILNSEGGSVGPAMKIGRLLRQHEATVLVDDHCYSSCFLIFIGGVSRMDYIFDETTLKFSNGKIGLHRPYFSANNPKGVVSENDVKLMYAEIHKYFTEMNISDSVFDVMMNTPPSEIKIFKEFKIFELIPDIDPVYDEKSVFRDSIDYGISTNEVRRRKNYAKKFCKSSKSVDCYESIIWDIPVSEVDIRRKKFIKNCAPDVLYTFEEKNIITSLSNDERYSNPITLRRKKCRIDYMLGIKQ